LFAEDEARAMNHRRKGTKHLLLGLPRERDGLAAGVLATMGLELSGARLTVEWILGRGDEPVAGKLGWSPRAAKVLDLSVAEARRLDHPGVGTEHLLLGIVREGRSIPPDQGKGIAAGVLETRGLPLRAVRDAVLRAMGAESEGDDGVGER
jgi:ATP-dependent Clp protease ATP-binding subunit ClpC